MHIIFAAVVEGHIAKAQELHDKLKHELWRVEKIGDKAYMGKLVIQSGVLLYDLKEMGDGRRWKMVQRYAHLALRHLQKVVNELRQQHPLNKLLNIAVIARSTFYYQCKTQSLPDKYADVKQMIQDTFHLHKWRYGYRRVTSATRSSGTLINHKTVQKLMQQLQLKSYIRIQKHRSYKGLVGTVAPNQK